MGDRANAFYSVSQQSSPIPPRCRFFWECCRLCSIRRRTDARVGRVGRRGRRGVAASTTIAQMAQEHGMRTLRSDGWNKVRAAQTTIEEVLRVTQTEEHLNLMEDKG